MGPGHKPGWDKFDRWMRWVLIDEYSDARPPDRIWLRVAQRAARQAAVEIKDRNRIAQRKRREVRRRWSLLTNPRFGLSLASSGQISSPWDMLTKWHMSQILM
jgi:hypothetical protein